MQSKEIKSGYKPVLEALNNNLIELNELGDDDSNSKTVGSLYYRNRTK